MIFTQACFHFCHIKHKCFLNAQKLIEHSDYSNNAAKGTVFCTATGKVLLFSITDYKVNTSIIQSWILFT